ncbi:IclR family transcriptional regulator [Oceanibaculum pacificum]|nr:IclR family transcriptional regulator [Oceanibaculum pacificum]
MLKMPRGGRKAPLYEDDPLDEDPKDRQFVTALARGLEVLRCFRPGDAGLGNQDIAERTGLPKPTISRLTHTLTRLGYLKYADRQGIYQLGPGVLALGYSMLAGLDIRDRARPLMQELADQANASVALGSRDRLSMVYLECCRGQGAVTLRLDVGSRVPIATTAMGRALLASLPEAERAYLLGLMRDRFPDEFPKLEQGVERAIRDIETRGFCLSLGDWQGDVHAAAVPLLAADRSAVFGLNCGGPSFLLSPRKLEEEIGPRLVEIAKQLTLR